MLKSLKSKRKNGVQEFSTSALPDIIFMLLFFFMVTTVVRDEEVKLKVDRPSAQQTDQIDQKELCSTLYLGYHKESGLPEIQIDEAIVPLKNVGQRIAEKRAELPEDQMGLHTVILKADREMPMKMITQVKEELRKINALKIQYSVERES